MNTFKNVKVNGVFICNGNKYKKVSLRTGKPLYDCHLSHFYFSYSEAVKIINVI